MYSSKLTRRPLQQLARHCRQSRVFRQFQQRNSSSTSAGIGRGLIDSGRAGLIAATGIAAVGLYATSNVHYAETIPAPAEIKFEDKRKKASSREENRDLISSQHLQVKRSWENPGVYVWGLNSGRVAADSDEANIKSPRRIPYFDGKLLRDLKLDKNFGAAVTENGDLLQWGIGYSPDVREPQVTLKGKDIKKISISRDRIIALGSNGTVYSVAASKADQDEGQKPSESTWIPLWKSKSPISYRTINPTNLGWREKVTDISSGLEHCLMLTNRGRLFTAVSGSEDFPMKGQMGIPGLTWQHRPPGPYDQPHEVTTLKGFDITNISAGDYHSVVLDKEGRVFAFGDNSLGQLALEPSAEAPFVTSPSLLPITKLYSGTNLTPVVTSISAGGVNTFFTVDATRVAGPQETDTENRGLGRVTADTWACGQGIWGGLGNGRWTHVQSTPTKIKALSGLFEYDEKKNTVIPIRLARLSVGSTHASAVMDNVTYVGAHDESSENDTNWGADVLWWGGNEFYQLGTGKRNNVSNPVYIPPLDVAADKEKGRREEHRFQITPKKKVTFEDRDGKTRTTSFEQRIECGRGVTAVYSGL